MPRYKNFDIAIYFTTRCIASIHSMEAFEKDFGFFEKHLKCSKVYIETHRDDMDPGREKLLQLKQFFENKGIEVSGAITTTFMKISRNKPMIDETGIYGCGGSILGNAGNAEQQVEKGYKKEWATLCYTDEASRQRFKEIVEFAASIFDEIILDDFFFTNCTCPACIESKGEKSWEAFRLELMTEVSENLVVKPAKAVNPQVKMIIKYPNWYEAYQETGYNPETQPDIFDLVYTGTETRDTNHSMQHLPRYGSYSIVRWFENLKPGRVGGGWIDQWNSIQNINYYIEQAMLTFFAKGKELTLFCYSWLFDTVYIPPLGHELERLDRVIGEMGNPVGVAVYEPFHATGEEHLYDYLGMAGLAFEPMHQFPDKRSLIMLTANSAKDAAVLEKLKAHLLEGGDVCLTSGFLKEMAGRGIDEITSAKYTDKKVCSRDYMIDGHGSVFQGSFSGRDEITLPMVKYMNNAADCLIAAAKNDNNFPVLLKNSYGKGIVYTLTIPDDYAEIYQYPPEVLTVIRQYLMSDLGIYIEGREKIALFLYDNNTFILDSFRSEYSTRIKIHLSGAECRLMEIRSGKEVSVFMHKDSETVFEIEIQPMFYKAFKILQ